jgi:hypothetical protein
LSCYIEAVAAAIRDNVPAADVPDVDTRDLFLMYAVLLLAKGALVDAADVHNAWSAWMCQRDPQHEALVPFEDLPASAMESDRPFVAAIRSVASEAEGGRTRE